MKPNKTDFQILGILAVVGLCLWGIVAWSDNPGKTRWQITAEREAAIQARIAEVEKFAEQTSDENIKLRARVEQLERVAGGLLPDPQEWDRIVAGGKK